MGDDMKIALLTIGDSQVGKSSLLVRFTSTDPAKYKPSTMPTIGIDFKMKNVEVDGRRIKLQIWDTAGQERFRTITNSYYRKVQGILLVYDITDRKTFDNIRQWVNQISIHAEVNVNKILVGNKFDLAQKRVVSHEDGAALAREFGIQFFETSAVTNTNVDNAFMSLVADIKTRLDAEALASGGADKTKGSKAKLTDKNKNKPASSSWC